MVEVDYPIVYGDLDLALFQDVDMGNGIKVPTRITADLTAVSNACIVAHNLMPNTKSNYYYVVVKGAARQDVPGTYAMNNYKFRISAVSESNPLTCTGGSPDLGM